MKWTVPLSKIDQRNIAYLDVHEGYGSVALQNFSIIDDNSILAVFKNNEYTSIFTSEEFEFITVIENGDAYIERCGPTTYYADVLYLIGNNGTHPTFGHYVIDIPINIKCQYPEIIQYSLEMNWNTTRLKELADAGPIFDGF
jgi:hypothetical protein